MANNVKSRTVLCGFETDPMFCYLFLWIIIVLQSLLGECTVYEWGRVVTAEYCDHESFEASCSPGETVIIGGAEYGHMAKGKCVQVNLGVFGCRADVSDILNDHCTGKESCSLRVDDEALRETKPCSVGISVYLKATYFCVKAVPDAQICQKIPADGSVRFIASSQASTGQCSTSTGLFDQEFQVAAKPGQQISFSLIDLSMFDPLITDQGNEDLGYILDSKSEKVFPIEPAGREESLIADTITNEVTIALSSHENRKFLIKFKAIGCSDLTLSSEVWIRRDGNAALVGCHDTQQTWRLECIHSHWAGVIGNCSLPPEPYPLKMTPAPHKLPLPKDIIIAIIGCATFFLAVLVITLGYVCLKWPRGPKPKEVSTLRFGQVRHHRIPSESDTYITPRYNHEEQSTSAEYQPIWSKPLPTPPSMDGRTSTRNEVEPNRPMKRNNEEVYNMSMASDTPDYAGRKYFVLDKDYMNPNRMQSNA